jgi:cysteinyl-tRNA synthetase
MQAAAARAERFRDVFRGPSEPAPDGAWERFAAALEDDFNTPAALAVMHEWRDHDLLRRALGIFGLESLAEEEQAPAEIVELAAHRQAARESRDFDEADRLRDELEAAGWEARDEPDGYRLVRRR